MLPLDGVAHLVVTAAADVPADIPGALRVEHVEYRGEKLQVGRSDVEALAELEIELMVTARVAVAPRFQEGRPPEGRFQIL